MGTDPDPSVHLVDLLKQEIPELASGDILVRAVAREPGVLAKVAVEAVRPTIDAVAVCLGKSSTRMSRIKERLEGEKLDLLRWHDEPEWLISNALKPAVAKGITLDVATKRASVTMAEDQIALLNAANRVRLRLASEIAGWQIDLHPA